jgi:DNA-directed RNA polymerase specialized sigma24 family protein
VRVCWAKLLLGWSAAEIAESVGLPPYAVSDALAQLRNELTQQLGNARTPDCGG